MSAEEKGIHQMFRESGRRPRESEQSAHRGTQEAERTLRWKWGKIGMIRFDVGARALANQISSFSGQVRHIISGHD